MLARPIARAFGLAPSSARFTLIGFRSIVNLPFLQKFSYINDSQMKFPYGIGLPVDISTHGHLIDHIFYVVHAFMALLFVGWFTFFVIALVRFRARPGHRAAYAPKHSKFSTYLEVGIALF